MWGEWSTVWQLTCSSEHILWAVKSVENPEQGEKGKKIAVVPHSVIFGYIMLDYIIKLQNF